MKFWRMNRKMREEQAREKRKLTLELLAMVERLADPRYTAAAAGFWLQRQAPPELRAWAQ